jgi:hypothetical protein
MRRVTESKGPVGVPISPISTPWSMSVEIATLLSALFAAIATIPILLHSRRFNLSLFVVEQILREATPVGDEDVLFCPTLRLISTKAIAPQLTTEIVLKVEGQSFLPRLVQTLPLRETPSTPITVKDELVIRLEYLVPRLVWESLVSGYTIVFKDVFCRRKFHARFGERAVRPRRALRALVILAVSRARCLPRGRRA